MKIGVTGSTGLVGSALLPLLTANGHEVHPLVRGMPEQNQIGWDPAAGRLNGADLAGLEGIVHLAGENVGAGRWNAGRKKRILDSRVQGTKLLCSKLAELESKPSVLVCASAIGYYGDRGDEAVDETAEAGSGFLADVCRQWEAACQDAREAGIRVVNLRIGVVLSPDGGALAKMLMPFKMGVGGRVGDGKQYFSWIALDDVGGAIDHALKTESLAGPVNAVSPQAVTNTMFTQVLGKVLRRPTIFPMPAFAMRLALGEMAEELLLASTRVTPTALQQSGYAFQFPDLEGALRHLLGR